MCSARSCVGCCRSHADDGNPPVAQASEQPALDNQHAGLDPRLRGDRLLAVSRGRRGRAGNTAQP
jgi:hypothetical protein